MTYSDYEKTYSRLELKSKDIKDFDIYWPNIEKADKKYPRLKLSFTDSDRETLSNIMENGSLRFDSMKSPIEKFLYAVLWKQGDLSKLRHILDGILNDINFEEKKKQMVFYQFGKHLRDNHQPIIDKNVLKAYAVAFEKRDALTSTGISESSKGIDLVKSYIQWVDEVAKNDDERFMVDRIMFAIGQQIKLPLS